MARIKSLQTGTLTIAASSSSNTQAITSVDTTKAFMDFSWRDDSSSPDRMLVNGEITSGTLLTFSRDTAGSSAPVIQWYVMEFEEGVTVQRGQQTMPDPMPKNVTITSTDLNKSFPIIGIKTDGATFGDDDFCTAEITTSTNLQLNLLNDATNMNVSWQVIEYDECAVQRGTTSFLSGDSSKTATLSPAVNVSRSRLIISYTAQSGTGTDIGQKMVRGRVTNGTTLTFDRDNTGVTIDVKWYVVEFTDRTFVQHVAGAFGTGDTLKNVAISSVALNRAVASPSGLYNAGGRTPYSANDTPGVSMFTADLTTSTNLALERDLTGTQTADVNAEVIEYGRRIY